MILIRCNAFKTKFSLCIIIIKNASTQILICEREKRRDTNDILSKRRKKKNKNNKNDEELEFFHTRQDFAQN